MKKTVLWVFAAILSICSTSVMTSCNNDDEFEYVKKNDLVGQWIIEQRVDGIGSYAKEMGMDIPAETDQLTFLYQFNSDGTGWRELVALKNGEYVQILVERYEEDAEFTYKKNAEGKVFVKAHNNKENDVLYFDGKMLKWKIGHDEIPFTRASEAQIKKYKNETDAWHGGNSEENVIDLSKVTHGIVLHDGDVLTGSIKNDNASIQIQDKATVTLRNARIAYRISGSCYESAGLECLGDATIILEGDNYVRGNYIGSPGIYIPECHTLTIKGSGSLEAVGDYNAPGIGSGKEGCSFDYAGNIVLEGGNIIAKGMNAPGIGTLDNTCGDITIKSTVGFVNAVNGIKTTGKVVIEKGANVIQ